jgi:hypothetical protein
VSCPAQARRLARTEHLAGTCSALFLNTEFQFDAMTDHPSCQVPPATFNQHFDDIVVMLHEAALLCAQEPAVLKLQQPCHIFGDIHGNYSDLKSAPSISPKSKVCNTLVRYFESTLWPLGVAFTAGSFLWLGDYVDRGNFSKTQSLRKNKITTITPLMQGLLPSKQSCACSLHFSR